MESTRFPRKGAYTCELFLYENWSFYKQDKKIRFYLQFAVFKTRLVDWENVKLYSKNCQVELENVLLDL